MTTVRDVQNQYIADFRTFTGNGAAGAPRWLRERRAQAIKRFAELGFPNSRDEAWRFTNVAPLVRDRFRRVDPGGEGAFTAVQIERYTLGPVGRNRLVFLDGRYRDDLSSLEGLPAGVEAGSLAGVLAQGGGSIEEHLGTYTGTTRNPFTTLGMAFLTDGALVRVPAGVDLVEPLLVLYITSPQANKRVCHPRNLVLVGAGASATVVEQYVALGDAVYWTNAVTEAALDEGGRLDMYRVQQEADQAFHTATTQSYQHRNSSYSLSTFVLGGAMTRHDINAELDGPGAECTLYGLCQLRGRQHADHHTTIVHGQPHCNSWEYFNGIYDDRARGVFTGRIVVRPGAQRTDSKQTNNSLLLSEHARSDSQPQLEIYADDVKCTHGATLGPIDERALFYLRSRGLSAEEARNLLTYGFGAEILGKVKLVELRDHLDQLIKTRLSQGATWQAAPA
jgi:Fe-S cluster assembly protein SufD